MKLLLDTHILLWWLADDRKLSARARALITARENTIFVSAVSLWEIRLKQSLGKLELPPDFDDILSHESFENLPLSGDHTQTLPLLPMFHRDPFDRMLIAQAISAGLLFITADEACRAYGPLVEVT